MMDKIFTKLHELNTLSSQLSSLGLYAYSLNTLGGYGSIQANDPDVYKTFAEELVTVKVVGSPWSVGKVTYHFYTTNRGFEFIYVATKLEEARELAQDLKEKGCLLTYKGNAMQELYGSIVDEVVEQVQAIAEDKHE